MLFLISSLPHLSNHSLYTDLIVELHSMGYDIKVVAPAISDKVGLSKENGVSVVRFKTNRLTQNTSFILKGIAYLKLIYKYPISVRRYFGKEKFDLIYANSLPLEIGVIILYLKKKYRAKFYLMLCDYLWQDLVALKILRKWNPIILYYRLLERLMFKNANYIGGLSKGYIDLAVKYHPFVSKKNTKVILPWATNESYNLKSNTQNFAIEDLFKDKFVAVYGGNVGIAQDMNNIIELAKSCLEYNDIVFVIIGKGAKFEDVKKLCEDMELDNVKFFDFMPKEDYVRFISSCDVGLISLNKELGAPNFPSKTATLFSLSIPIVAAIDKVTDFGSYLDTYHVGLWSLSGDICSFKSNLIKLYNDPVLLNEMSANAYNFYMNYMTVQKAFEKFNDQINGL